MEARLLVIRLQNIKLKRMLPALLTSRCTPDLLRCLFVSRTLSSTAMINCSVDGDSGGGGGSNDGDGGRAAASCGGIVEGRE